MRKAKSKAVAATGMTAAECARRTGVTIRALRVYERRGLIRPARSAKGWRLYGPEELIRLNSIVALKASGLALSQIRKAFVASPPVLAQMLDVQLKVWTARRMAAHQAIGGIQAALGRLQAGSQLSIDELCELLRNVDMNKLQVVTRELINKHITPEQEREWLTYWSQRPAEEGTDAQARFAAGKVIAAEILALMRGGATPNSPEVQVQVRRSYDNWLKPGMRERQLEQFAWNPGVTKAWSALGSRLLARAAVPDDPAEAEKLHTYMLEARRVSPAAEAFRPLAEQAAKLRDDDVPLTGSEARDLARRYAQVCREHDFGDPAVHARWIAAFGEFDDKTRELYVWLAKVVNA